MARAYQDAHIIDNLTSSVKTLQSQATELLKAKGLHEERLTNLQKQNTEQAKKIEALETRCRANEYNTTARLLNAHIYHTHNLHLPLTPLYDLTIARPIRKFPKHERDFRTMAIGEVIQILQALDVKTMGMSAGEKKGELRAQIGLPRDVDPAQATTALAVREVAQENVSGKQVEEGRKMTLPKVAPGSTAERKGRVGTGSKEGVSPPAVKAGEKTA